MEFAGAALRVFISATVIGTVAVVLHLYNKLWKKPEETRKKLRAQGISGPPVTFLYGNSPEMKKIQLEAAKRRHQNHGSGGTVTYEDDYDYSNKFFPYLEKWRKQYGHIYTYSTGIQQHLYVNNVELVKELSLATNLDLGKPSYLAKTFRPMFGNSILGANGALWAHQKKIIAPQFFFDKVKGMVDLMLDSAQLLVNKWETTLNEAEDQTAEIKVDEDLRGFSADVISRACFGSSYAKGKQIFSKLRDLQKIIGPGNNIFGHSFRWNFQWKRHRKIQKLEKEIEALIWETVEERQRECSKIVSSKKDLLQLIMEGAVNDPTTGGRRDCYKNFIVGNCKSIYFAGHETTALTACWCLMLLALHPDWQSRIRTELSRVCPHGYPDATSISHLKTVSMVVQEVLRLYPPSVFIVREAQADTRVGNIMVPKGICLWAPIPTLLRDSNIWGDDANKFKPERFANGIAKACKFPQAYIPFGMGHRMCLGKNFALVELKIIISLIVSKFQISLSPRYQHRLTLGVLVEPADGVRIVIQRL